MLSGFFCALDRHEQKIVLSVAEHGTRTIAQLTKVVGSEDIARVRARRLTDEKKILVRQEDERREDQLGPTPFTYSLHPGIRWEFNLKAPNYHPHPDPVPTK